MTPRPDKIFLMEIKTLTFHKFTTLVEPGHRVDFASHEEMMGLLRSLANISHVCRRAKKTDFMTI